MVARALATVILTTGISSFRAGPRKATASGILISPRDQAALLLSSGSSSSMNCANISIASATRRRPRPTTAILLASRSGSSRSSMKASEAPKATRAREALSLTSRDRSVAMDRARKGIARRSPIASRAEAAHSLTDGSSSS